MPTIKVHMLASVVNSYLDEFGDEAYRANNEAIRKVAKDVTKDLKKAGSFGGSGAFRKSIGAEIENTRVGLTATIGAKAPHYRLTHLLEFGHAKQNGGRVEGYNFVAPINNTVYDRYKKEMEVLLTK